MVSWGRGSGDSPQSKIAKKTRSSTSGAAAINSLAKQYDKPVKWRLQGSLEQRIQAWYQPVVRSAVTSLRLHYLECCATNPTVCVYPACIHQDYLQNKLSPICVAVSVNTSFVLLPAAASSCSHSYSRLYCCLIRHPSEEDADSSAGQAVQAALPLRLLLTGSASGNPDLRLQLLSVKVGTACERVRHQQASDHRTAGLKGNFCSGQLSR